MSQLLMIGMVHNLTLGWLFLSVVKWNHVDWMDYMKVIMQRCGLRKQWSVTRLEGAMEQERSMGIGDMWLVKVSMVGEADQLVSIHEVSLATARQWGVVCSTLHPSNEHLIPTHTSNCGIPDKTPFTGNQSIQLTFLSQNLVHDTNYFTWGAKQEYLNLSGYAIYTNSCVRELRRVHSIHGRPFRTLTYKQYWQVGFERTSPVTQCMPCNYAVYRIYISQIVYIPCYITSHQLITYCMRHFTQDILNIIYCISYNHMHI